MVDDDLELAMIYKELLGSQGYTVTVAPNGAEALKIIMKQDLDAIVCDMLMPHMAGDMFYLAVERVKPNLCKRFIFVTAYDSNPRISEFFKKVKAVPLYKPVTHSKMLVTLNILNQRLLDEEKNARA